MHSKEELRELLRKYEGYIPNSIKDYLNSLIELEFSVVRENIEAKDRQFLSELDVYKQIAIYNIYNRALNIFKQNEKDFESLEIMEEPNELKVTTLIEGKEIFLFNYNYNDNIALGVHRHEMMYLGTILLFQMLDCKEELSRCFKSKKMNELKIKLEHLIFGGYDLIGQCFENSKKLIEITQQVYNLFEKDYDLSYRNFSDENSNYELIKYYKQENIYGYGLEEITRVRTIPNLNIERKKTYI